MDECSTNLDAGKTTTPPAGLILCTSKDETIVKFSVLKGSEQLFTSKYRLILPSEEELIVEIDREKRLLEMREEE